LQDDCGVDVNLLLFSLWLAAGKRQLSAADVKRLDETVRRRDLTIVPIRDARRKLKGPRLSLSRRGGKRSAPRSRRSSSRPSGCSRKPFTA